jgi:hypothetical protein
MKKLFLDDIRNPGDCVSYMRPNEQYYDIDWDIVRNYNDFVNYINENGVPDEISFDHDLADEHYDPSMYKSHEEYNKGYDNFKDKTGYDCVKWLSDYCVENIIPMPKCYVHSMNPVGRDNIWSVINSTNKILNKVM